jgi:hypothetical protein
MSIEKLSSERIISGRRLNRIPEATHIRVEGKYLVQYKCNPTNESCMNKIPKDVESFIIYEIKVNRKISSSIVKTNGEKNPTTFHYSAI